MTVTGGPAKKRSRGLLAGFLRDVRGGAVGVPSVLMTLMCFGGTAMVSDHIALVHNRNVLRAAAASGTLVATQRMTSFDDTDTDEEVEAALKPVVRRFILANLPEKNRDKVDLEITLTLDRDAGLADVRVTAELGGAIVGRNFWGEIITRITTGSGAERIVAPVDLVLAIDVTGSMNSSIIKGESGTFLEANRRINVVREAAMVLISGLYDQEGDTRYVSVGLVPFNTTVNVGSTRSGWVSDLGTGHKVVPAGFGSWGPCVEHRKGGLDLTLDTPSQEPFTAWFYPSTLTYRPAEREALVQAVGTVRGENDWSADTAHEGYANSPNYGCPQDEIIPLTNDRDRMEQAIQNLQPWRGGGTMIHLGAVWGRRLLAEEWRDAWGLSAQGFNVGKRRALVLLTDGLNDAYDYHKTYPGNYRAGDFVRTSFNHVSEYTGYGRAGSGTVEEGHRANTRISDVTNDTDEIDILDTLLADACQNAKDDGITVFTVSAVPHGHTQEERLREMLVSCATTEDHAFVENSEPDRMKEAFRKIGEMVAWTRRTY